MCYAGSLHLDSNAGASLSGRCSPLFIYDVSLVTELKQKKPVQGSPMTQANKVVLAHNLINLGTPQLRQVAKSVFRSS